MALVLHIGIHKTGTTSLQEWLAANGPVLNVMGVHYPQTGLLYGAHHNLASAVFDPSTLKQWQPGEYLEALAQEVTNPPAPTVVLSSEWLWPFQPDPLLSALPTKPHKVVFYIRRQDQWFESMYREHLKNFDFGGSPEEYFEFIRSYPLFGSEGPCFDPDYCKLYEMWASIVGKDNVIVRQFRRNGSSGGIVLDFLNAIGVDWAGEEIRVERRNDSFKAAILQFRKMIDPRMSRKARTLLIDGIWWANEHLSFEHGQFFSPDLRRRIMQHYATGNETLAGHLGLDQHLFALDDAETSDWQEPTSIDLAGVASIISAMVARIDARQKSLEERMNQLERTLTCARPSDANS